MAPRPDCINYTYAFEQAESVEELTASVRHLLLQYELEILSVVHSEASWGELAEIVQLECDADPDRPVIVALLELAEQRSDELSEKG